LRNFKYGVDMLRSVYFDNKKFVKTHKRLKNTSCKVNNYFMFAICFTQTKLTSINCNDEINNQSFQTVYLIVAWKELIFQNKSFF
jgi:hypothetical protein